MCTLRRQAKWLTERIQRTIPTTIITIWKTYLWRVFGSIIWKTYFRLVKSFWKWIVIVNYARAKRRQDELSTTPVQFYSRATVRSAETYATAWQDELWYSGGSRSRVSLWICIGRRSSQSKRLLGQYLSHSSTPINIFEGPDLLLVPMEDPSHLQ